MTNEAKTLGSMIRKNRLLFGYTQSQVADFLGIESVQQVSDWERGNFLPPRKHIPTLCKELKIAKKEVLEILVSACTKELKALMA